MGKWVKSGNGLVNSAQFIDIEVRWVNENWVVTGWCAVGEGSYTLGIFSTEEEAYNALENIFSQINA